MAGHEMMSQLMDRVQTILEPEEFIQLANAWSPGEQSAAIEVVYLRTKDDPRAREYHDAVIGFLEARNAGKTRTWASQDKADARSRRAIAHISP